MEKNGIFTNIGKIVDNALNTIQNASLNDKFMQLQGMIGLLLTLSIMYKGYQTIAGRAKDPIREIVWDVAKKMLILTFVLNVNGWLDLSISALKGFYEWAGGGVAFYEKLDKLVDAFFKTTNDIWKIDFDGVGTDGIVACFVIFFMFLGFLAIMLSFAFTIINATITNTFLIIALPLALICFMYDFTKQAFVQWFNMFVSNIFLLLFMSAFTDFLIKNLTKLYADTLSKNPIAIILTSILISAILITIIQVIKTMASQLAQFSLDSADSSGMGQAMRMAGGAGGLAWKGTKGTAKTGLGVVVGAASGGALKAATRGGLAGLAGYGLKKGIVGLAGGAISGAKKLFGMARNKA